jgi:outer membrane usher protein
MMPAHRLARAHESNAPRGSARRSSSLRACAIAALVAVVCLASLSAHRSDPTDRRDDDHDDDAMRAVAALILNGEPAGDTVFVRSDGSMWIPAGTLRDAGVQTRGGLERGIDGRPFISLESLAPDVTYEFDELDVVLRLQVRASRLGSQVIRLQTLRPEGLERLRNASGFLNYAVNASGAGVATTAETGINVRGLLLHGSLSRDERGTLLRGPVSLTIDDERRLRRWEIGDATMAGGAFGGVVSIAGVSVSREFTIDPYFVQYTPLTLTGSAATPSTADVYVNGQLVRRLAIAPGAFTLRDLPVSVGAGQAQVIVRDAFGREQRIGSSFYTPASVLAKGLQQYRYGVGVQRIATQTLWDYGSPAAVGEHRIGVREGLTLGGRVEAGRDLAGLAPSLALRLPVGEVETMAAVSRSKGRTGGAGLLAWSYRGPRVSGALSWRGTTRDYAVLGENAIVTDLARAGVGAGVVQLPSIRSDVQASAGWVMTSRLNLSAYYARLRDSTGERELRSECGADCRAGADRASAPGLEQRALIGASWQTGSKIAVNASVGRSRIGGRLEREVFVGMNVILGGRASASAGVHGGSSSGASLAVQQSAPLGPGYGYRVQWQPDSNNVAMDLQAQGGAGRIDVRSDRLSGGGFANSVTVAGALAMAGGRVFASRPIDDAFAVVRVSEVEGVRAYSSNQFVGRTNRRGEVLVPNLLSYYGNRVSIAPEDVPLTHAVGNADRTVAPSLRGGALVSFSAPAVRAIVGRFVLGARRIVPAFGDARASVLRDAEVSPLGAQGEFYFERFTPGWHRVSVLFGGLWYECRVQVPDAPDPTGRPTDIGTVLCREVPLRSEAIEDTP